MLANHVRSQLIASATLVLLLCGPAGAQQAQSLVDVPPPAGKSEAECRKLHPQVDIHYVDCVAPPYDMSRNPRLRRFFDACTAAREAVLAHGLQMKSAQIVVDGTAHSCETSGW